MAVIQCLSALTEVISVFSRSSGMGQELSSILIIYSYQNSEVFLVSVKTNTKKEQNVKDNS